MPLVGQDSKPDSLMGNACGLLEDPAGFSPYMVPCMGNPVLVNLFYPFSVLAINGPPHRLLLPVSPHCIAGPLGWSPTRLPKLYCPFQSSSGVKAVLLLPLFPTFFSFAWLGPGADQWVLLLKQRANRWLRWQFHLILMESLRVFTVLALGRRRTFMGKGGTCITLGNRTCRPLRTPRPILPFTTFWFYRLVGEKWNCWVTIFSCSLISPRPTLLMVPFRKCGIWQPIFSCGTLL